MERGRASAGYPPAFHSLVRDWPIIMKQRCWAERHRAKLLDNWERVRCRRAEGQGPRSGGSGYRPGRHYERPYEVSCWTGIGQGLKPARPVSPMSDVAGRAGRGLSGGVRSPKREPRWSAERRAHCEQRAAASGLMRPWFGCASRRSASPTRSGRFLSQRRLPAACSPGRGKTRAHVHHASWLGASHRAP
jgi:hypothetical protein